MKKYLIWLISLAFAFVVIIEAFFINYKKEEPEENFIVNSTEVSNSLVTDDCLDEWEDYAKTISEEVEFANSKIIKVSPNAKIIKKRYFKETNYTFEEEQTVNSDLVNKTKEEVEEYFSSWDIEKFDEDTIILYKIYNGQFKHYYLQKYNGKIAVFLYLDGEKIFYKDTDISIEYLTDEDLEDIKNNPDVYGDEELNERIEDFE